MKFSPLRYKAVPQRILSQSNKCFPISYGFYVCTSVLSLQVLKRRENGEFRASGSLNSEFCGVEGIFLKIRKMSLFLAPVYIIMISEPSCGFQPTRLYLLEFCRIGFSERESWPDEQASLYISRAFGRDCHYGAVEGDITAHAAPRQKTRQSCRLSVELAPIGPCFFGLCGRVRWQVARICG